jgi:hypothetical protein
VPSPPRIKKPMMCIQPVVKKGLMKEIDEQQDLLYWLSKSARERMEAVTFIVSQFLKPGESLDKTAVVKRKMNDDIG